MPKNLKQLIELDSALDIFLIDCSSRNLSKKTIFNYKETLGIFIKFCADKNVVNLDDLTANIIRQYITSLQKRNLSSTLNPKL